MNNFLSREQVARIRQKYPPGTQVELLNMPDDPHPIPPGTRGEVKAVNDAGQLVVKWNNCSTCLLFQFTDDVKLDVSKLAAWRLASHSSFGGTWLSDFVPNYLGGFVRDQPEQRQTKPDCPLIGQNGNVYNLMGIAAQTLREHGMEEQAKEMFQRIFQCHSYDSALNIIGDYVNITSVEQTENWDMEMQ